jgi:hypothetical protein
MNNNWFKSKYFIGLNEVSFKNFNIYFVIVWSRLVIL